MIAARRVRRGAPPVLTGDPYALSPGNCIGVIGLNPMWRAQAADEADRTAIEVSESRFADYEAPSAAKALVSPLISERPASRTTPRSLRPYWSSKRLPKDARVKGPSSAMLASDFWLGPPGHNQHWSEARRPRRCRWRQSRSYVFQPKAIAVYVAGSPIPRYRTPSGLHGQISQVHAGHRCTPHGLRCS